MVCTKPSLSDQEVMFCFEIKIVYPWIWYLMSRYQDGGTEEDEKYLAKPAS